MPWRELEHPADILLEIEAESPEALVVECARALFFFAVGSPLEESEQDVPGVVSVHAAEGDFAGLLVAWMNELVFNLDAAQRVFVPMDVQLNVSRGHLFVSGKWVIIPAGGSRVKAVTYGGLEFHPGPPSRLRVILDV